MVTQISRDPFARQAIMRRTVSAKEYGGGAYYSCAWCGTRRTRVFQYGYQPDSTHGRIAWDNNVYCYIGCWRAYHDISL